MHSIVKLIVDTLWNVERVLCSRDDRRTCYMVAMSRVCCSCADQFLMMDSLGRITLRRSISTSLNISSVSLSVTAHDDSSCCQPTSPRLSNTTTIVVQIIGVNTQPTFPQCHSYRASVRENAPVNTSVLRVCSWLWYAEPLTGQFADGPTRVSQVAVKTTRRPDDSRIH